MNTKLLVSNIPNCTSKTRSAERHPQHLPFSDRPDNDGVLVSLAEKFEIVVKYLNFRGRKSPENDR